MNVDKHFFSIEDMIKVLLHRRPVDRDRMLWEWEEYPESKKNALTEIFTSEFRTLCEDLAVVKYKEFMTEIKEGKRKPSTDMMVQARFAVDVDLQAIIEGKQVENEKIQKIRTKIKNMI